MGQRRVLVIIDGANFYFGLKRMLAESISLSNFDYASFVHSVVGCVPNQKLYCVGEIRLDRSVPKTAQLYNAQRRLFAHLASRTQNFQIKKGFLLKNGDRFQEKGVDTFITMELLVGAYENTYDTCFLFSSDTDFVPAIQKVRALGKEIVYVGFRDRLSYALMHCASRTTLIDKHWLDIFFQNQYA